MARRPSFQFYPADWKLDRGLRLCSHEVRGFWIDLLCEMHDSPDRGFILMHENPPSKPPSPQSYGPTSAGLLRDFSEKLARLVGEDKRFVRRVLGDLLENNVASISTDGHLYSRRMVADEERDQIRINNGKLGKDHGVKGAAYGHLGGRPAKQKPAQNKPPKNPPPTDDPITPLKPPPSSSSSSSVKKSVANATPKKTPHRLPDDWMPAPLPPTVQALADLWPAGRIEREIEQFRDYWHSRSRDAAKIDWQKTWHYRIRDQHDRILKENRNGTNGSTRADTLRGPRPDPALDIWLAAQADLRDPNYDHAAEAERENQGFGGPDWT